MAWYGNQNQLESDFVVAPQADPRAIQFTVEDPAKLAVDHDGNLTIGGLKLLKPVIYQQAGNQRRVIAGRYALAESKSLHRRVSFEVASYDRAKPLVIDPGVTLSYSTYL
ncbi:MAG: hypothetical protein ACREQT_01760, partial [Candidatus Binataceae bacterium]